MFASKVQRRNVKISSQLLPCAMLLLWLHVAHLAAVLSKSDAVDTRNVRSPRTFVDRALKGLEKLKGGYSPTPHCDEKVGMGYLQFIRDTKTSFCFSDGDSGDASDDGTALPPTRSSVDCYYASSTQNKSSDPSAIARVTMCRSRNLVLDSCGFYAGQRKGVVAKKMSVPTRGAVRLACTPVDLVGVFQMQPELKSVHTDTWWRGAIKDEDVVQSACAPDSPTLIKTPTLFVMRDRHANYAHEMEVLTVAFAFLAALDPQDVKQQGVQVVVIDQAPPTGFMENWARLSNPFKVRYLAADPLPPHTCFASAYHVHTFAAGIGYNVNGATVGCPSPVVTGFSHWLRALYRESNEEEMARQHHVGSTGLVLKNVMWLSRRNLEAIRMLLGANPAWKAARLLANEEALKRALHAAVGAWNDATCIVQRFNREVEAEYERGIKALAGMERFGTNAGSRAEGGGQLPAQQRSKASIANSSSLPLTALWEGEADCRRGNVLFTFVDGEFSNWPYHEQLTQVFRTGVLAGVHGAGLAHGFFMAPGQSAVLQLLDNAFASAPPNNVFRNMARGVGNYYEDVLYSGPRVDTRAVVKALHRAMDHVADAVFEAQQRAAGEEEPRLVLSDQFHYDTLRSKSCAAVAAAALQQQQQGQ